MNADNVSFQPWRFAHANDLHLGSPRSYRFDPSRNENWATARRIMIGHHPDLLLVGGDLTRDGDSHDFEYQLVKDDFESLPFPAFIIPGNMDVGNKHAPCQGAMPDRDDVSLNVTSARLERFAAYFGSPNWTLIHKNVRFTGFFDAVAGSGLPEEERMWHMLERLPDLPMPGHHVVVIHSAFFIDRIDEPNFDLTKEDEYLPWYFGVDRPHRDRMMAAFVKSGVTHVFSGHVHRYRPPFRVGNITFHQTPTPSANLQLEGRWTGSDDRIGFQICTVKEDSIDVEFVPVEPLSQAPARGPMGHPRPEERVYPENGG